MEKYKHTVHYYETDRMGFTHHSNYIRWMEEARIDFFDQLGWSYQKFEDEGVISPVTAVECKYKQTTTFPEDVYISIPGTLKYVAFHGKRDFPVATGWTKSFQ